MKTTKLEREQKARQKEFYDSFSEDYDDFELWRERERENNYRLRFMQRRAAAMAKLAFLSPNSVILDVGCGTGNHTIYWINFSRQVCGLDLSSRMLKKAASKINSNKLMLVEADAEHLPFKDSCFDAVLSINTLEHLDDIPLALREMKEVCKRNGTIVVSTPNHNIMQYNLTRLYNKCASFLLSDYAFRPGRYGNDLTHRSLTVDELLYYFRKCGIRLRRKLFMGFIERKLSKIAWASVFMEFLEKMLERAPMVKSWAGVMIVSGQVSEE